MTQSKKFFFEMPTKVSTSPNQTHFEEQLVFFFWFSMCKGGGWWGGGEGVLKCSMECSNA